LTLLAEWTSKSAQETYLQTDAFKATREVARQFFASKLNDSFVQFPSTEGIFSAPVTEFVTFTLKEGVNMDKLKPLVEQLQAGLQGTPNSKFHGSSWALVIDKPNVYHGVLGWDSVQVIVTMVLLSHPAYRS